MQDLQSKNFTVHRAAANDVHFKFRAVRGSLCNGLLCYVASWVALPIGCSFAGAVFPETDDEQKPRDDQS
ncbi:hypothetical protein Q31a_41890 [Aureliella helgolandensis]|uniref:Uncharacterized protein n=1 Tax=Aureliella helgolandensis TaxID=2527968 RepID=A0A518GB68_9BACT|nr:hypothetical protein Q31a_41890 [Aureliella helgolandensis]